MLCFCVATFRQPTREGLVHQSQRKVQLGFYLKVYARKIHKSNKISTQCKTDVIHVWQQTPGHGGIRFSLCYDTSDAALSPSPSQLIRSVCISRRCSSRNKRREREADGAFVFLTDMNDEETLATEENPS